MGQISSKPKLARDTLPLFCEFCPLCFQAVKWINSRQGINQYFLVYFHRKKRQPITHKTIIFVDFLKLCIWLVFCDSIVSVFSPADAVEIAGQIFDFFHNHFPSWQHSEWSRYENICDNWSNRRDMFNGKKAFAMSRQEHYKPDLEPLRSRLIKKRCFQGGGGNYAIRIVSHNSA